MKVLKWIDKNLEEVLIAFTIVVIAVVMFMQFTFRLFGSSLTWSEEVSRYMFVWSVGLGISYATKNNKHLRMDVLPQLVPKLAPSFDFISDLSVLVVSVWMLGPGYKTLSMLAGGTQVGATTGVPMWIVYLSMYAGFVLSIIRLAQKYGGKLIARIKSQKKESK